jgi:hypothetical protein
MTFAILDDIASILLSFSASLATNIAYGLSRRRVRLKSLQLPSGRITEQDARAILSEVIAARYHRHIILLCTDSNALKVYQTVRQIWSILTPFPFRNGKTPSRVKSSSHLRFTCLSS